MLTIGFTANAVIFFVILIGDLVKGFIFGRIKTDGNIKNYMDRYNYYANVSNPYDLLKYPSNICLSNIYHMQYYGALVLCMRETLE